MKRTLIVGILSLITLCSCGPTLETEIKREVDSIYMHGIGQYTFMYTDENSNEITHCGIGWTASEYKCKVIADVPEGEKCWYLAKYYRRMDPECYYIEIHIHSVDDINTSDWNNGKSGRGTIKRIE
jgi:hypothetical protein